MNIHLLDLQFLGQPGLIASYLLEDGGELALVETGPGSTLPTLLKAIRAAGFAPNQIRKVLVTHVHLDHSGAAGWWAQQGATVYVHPRGATHIVDPTKLVDSARRVYGDQMDRLWGDILPAPADRVVALQDGEKVNVGKSELIAVDTPGHARHHLAYVLGDACFTGDVAGMRLQQCNYLSVTAAPPQFDPVEYAESLNRLHEAHFAKLYLTHFGEVTDVAEHLAGYALRVEQVHEKVSGLMQQGLSGAALREAYREAEREVAANAGANEEQWRDYELANPTGMCADGIALYVSKHS